MHWVYDLGKAIAQSVVRSACHPCSLASRGKQIIPALLTVISTIVFVPVLSFLTTSPSCLCTSARLLFLYITLGLFSLSSVLLRDLRVPLSFRFAMTTAPPPNAQGLRAEKLVSLPSLACSLSSLPNATSMDGISLHHSMYAQRAAESEAKLKKVLSKTAASQPHTPPPPPIPGYMNPPQYNPNLPNSSTPLMMRTSQKPKFKA